MEGFNHVVFREFQRWWKTPRGYTLLAVFSIASFFITLFATRIAANIQDTGNLESNLQSALSISNSIIASLGVLLAMLRAANLVLGEQKSGALVWILSQPISRAAYVCGKIFVDCISFSVCCILVPIFGMYLILSREVVSFRNFQACALYVLLISATLVFWYTLAFMLSILLRSREGSLSIAIVCFFFLDIILNLVGAVDRFAQNIADTAPWRAWEIGERGLQNPYIVLDNWPVLVSLVFWICFMILLSYIFFKDREIV
jgi:ABC-type transport system involved in multi-copper enzyme maturation permease subunit